jgi:hypothetical protein
MTDRKKRVHENSRLKKLFGWGDQVTLVPYSGIQFLDFGFDLEGRKFRPAFVERKIGERGAEHQLKLEEVPLDRDAADAFLGTLGPDDNGPYTIDARKAMEPFLEKWVPVPVLRLKKERGPGGTKRYDPGPSAWARVRVVELAQPDEETGHTHRVQMAFDTALVHQNAVEVYLAPERADVENPREFELVSKISDMAWFLMNPKQDASGEQVDMQRWASDWIEDLFMEMLQARRPGKPVIKEDFDNKLEHWARYVAFLGMLQDFVTPPTIRFVNTISERDSVPPVEVDLVLDIGNSRTCGIMIERFPGEAQVDLRRSYQLELRDLGRPEFSYEGLVESRVEFAEQQFGKETFASGSGRRNAFLWPSFVRMGPEAMRLIEQDKGTETLSGMSSPKRYLWDDAPIQQDWRFHHHHDANSLPRAARAAMQYLNERGDVIEQVKSEEQGRYRSRNKTPLNRAIRPRFSRSAVFGFMLTEVLAHALVCVNDPASRSRRRQADLPRRLNRVILTLPTATPIQEQAIIRSRAGGALKLLWKRLGLDDQPSNISQSPELIVDWDEASCTQLVYLYSEITQKFEGRINEYVNLKGRMRPGPDGRRMEPSLRLACIDIGGGTTDLMVTTYRAQDDRMLHPEQTFREGFRIAGDDFLQRVVSGVVLPQLIASIEKAGGFSVTERFREMFGGDTSNVEQQKIQQRIQFALRVLQPVAVSLVEACEHTEDRGTIRVSTEDVFGTTFAGGTDPYLADGEEDAPAELLLQDDLIRYIEQTARDLGAPHWKLRDFEVVCDRMSMDAIVRDAFQTALANMVEVIDHFQSDIVLLTGRPSRLPAVRTIVEEMMCVPPDRLVSMHRYRTDNWYPYRDPVTQRIGDPKSTVAVGGMLISLAEERIPNFSVTTDAFRMRSTAKFIGEMGRNGQIENDRIFFRNVDLDQRKSSNASSAQVKMYTPMYIGSRQLPLDRWTTTPLYRLDFTQAAQGQKKPFLLKLVQAEYDDDGEDETSEGNLRREALREAFTIEEILDANDNDVRPTDVTLRLHTLGFDDSYWLDTGEFNI